MGRRHAARLSGSPGNSARDETQQVGFRAGEGDAIRAGGRVAMASGELGCSHDKAD